MTLASGKAIASSCRTDAPGKSTCDAYPLNTSAQSSSAPSARAFQWAGWSGFCMTSTMWWQGPSPSCSNAIFVDIVPVRPKPEPITFNPIGTGPFMVLTVGLLSEISLRQAATSLKRMVFSADEGNSATPDRPESPRGFRGADAGGQRRGGREEAQQDPLGGQPRARPVARAGGRPPDGQGRRTHAAQPVRAAADRRHRSHPEQHQTGSEVARTLQ